MRVQRPSALEKTDREGETPQKRGALRLACGSNMRQPWNIDSTLAVETKTTRHWGVASFAVALAGGVVAIVGLTITLLHGPVVASPA